MSADLASSLRAARAYCLSCVLSLVMTLPVSRRSPCFIFQASRSSRSYSAAKSLGKKSISQAGTLDLRCLSLRLMWSLMSSAMLYCETRLEVLGVTCRTRLHCNGAATLPLLLPVEPVSDYLSSSSSSSHSRSSRSLRSSSSGLWPTCLLRFMILLLFNQILMLRSKFFYR